MPSGSSLLCLLLVLHLSIVGCDAVTTTHLEVVREDSLSSFACDSAYYWPLKTNRAITLDGTNLGYEQPPVISFFIFNEESFTDFALRPVTAASILLGSLIQQWDPLEHRTMTVSFDPPSTSPRFYLLMTALGNGRSPMVENCPAHNVYPLKTALKYGADRTQSWAAFIGPDYLLTLAVTIIALFTVISLLLLGVIAVIMSILFSRSTSNQNVVTTPYSLLGAYLLLMFGGVFGLHHFYLRSYRKGILYVLTFGLGGVGVVRDALALPQTVHVANMMMNGFTFIPVGLGQSSHFCCTSSFMEGRRHDDIVGLPQVDWEVQGDAPDVID